MLNDRLEQILNSQTNSELEIMLDELENALQAQIGQHNLEKQDTIQTSYYDQGLQQSLQECDLRCREPFMHPLQRLNATQIDASLFRVQNKGDFVECGPNIQHIDSELSQYQRRHLVSKDRQREQRPLQKDVEIDSLSNMLGLLSIQQKDLMVASFKNKKMDDYASTCAYLKSKTKEIVDNSFLGQHKFQVIFQSDCGIYIAGKLNQNFIVVLELDLFYGQPVEGQFQNMMRLLLHDIVFDLDSDVQSLLNRRIGWKGLQNQSQDDIEMQKRIKVINEQSEKVEQGLQLNFLLEKSNLLVLNQKILPKLLGKLCQTFQSGNRSLQMFKKQDLGQHDVQQKRQIIQMSRVSVNPNQFTGKWDNPLDEIGTCPHSNKQKKMNIVFQIFYQSKGINHLLRHAPGIKVIQCSIGAIINQVPVQFPDQQMPPQRQQFEQQINPNYLMVKHGLYDNNQLCCHFNVKIKDLIKVADDNARDAGQAIHKLVQRIVERVDKSFMMSIKNQFIAHNSISHCNNLQMEYHIKEDQNEKGKLGQNHTTLQVVLTQFKVQIEFQVSNYGHLHIGFRESKPNNEGQIFGKKASQALSDFFNNFQGQNNPFSTIEDSINASFMAGNPPRENQGAESSQHIEYSAGVIFIQLIIVNCLMSYLEHQIVIQASLVCKDLSFGRDYVIQRKNLSIYDMVPNKARVQNYDSMELQKERDDNKRSNDHAQSYIGHFSQIFQLKPIEVSERALRKIEIYDNFEVMKSLFTSTRDNLFIFNSKFGGVLEQRAYNCPVLRVRDLFNNFDLNGSSIVLEQCIRQPSDAHNHHNDGRYGMQEPKLLLYQNRKNFSFNNLAQLINECDVINKNFEQQIHGFPQLMAIKEYLQQSNNGGNRHDYIQLFASCVLTALLCNKQKIESKFPHNQIFRMDQQLQHQHAHGMLINADREFERRLPLLQQQQRQQQMQQQQARQQINSGQNPPNGASF